MRFDIYAVEINISIGTRLPFAMHWNVPSYHGSHQFYLFVPSIQTKCPPTLQHVLYVRVWVLADQQFDVSVDKRHIKRLNNPNCYELYFIYLLVFWWVFDCIWANIIQCRTIMKLFKYLVGCNKKQFNGILLVQGAFWFGTRFIERAVLMVDSWTKSMYTVHWLKGWLGKKRH